MFSLSRTRRLASIRERIASPHQADRVVAMQELRRWARLDVGIRADALPLFEEAIAREPDRSTVIHAAFGIVAAAGSEAGRRAWLTLLDRDDAKTVASVAGAIEDPELAPVLIALARRRDDFAIRQSVLRTLGRLRVPGTLPFILESADVRALRPAVVQALTDFGDASAIPALTTLLDDRTEAGIDDPHAPPLRVCDVAQRAIDQLRAADPSR